jgi:hypothetical protein
VLVTGEAKHDYVDLVVLMNPTVFENVPPNIHLPLISEPTVPYPTKNPVYENIPCIIVIGVD